MSRLWHPFADMATVKDDEFVIVRGQGARVWDEQGREYVDARGGLWYCAVGHGRGEIADAASAQMRELAGYDTFGATANRPAIALAERVSSLAPFSDGAVFFASGGSDAVDTAGKLALRYWHAVGRPEKRTIVHRERSYHGMNAYGTSLAGIPANREGFGPLVPDTASVGTDDVDALEQLFVQGADSIAAFIGEPVIGAGGIFHPAPGYWQRVQELCTAHDVLLIADEVICGFGRLGTSGYLPLGAVIAAPRVQRPFWEAPGQALFRHGYTYSGHPSVCAAALANLEILEREGLLERVARLEPVLAESMRPLADLSLVSQVRSGVGLLAAIEIDAEARAADPGLVDRIVAGCRDRGVLTRALAGHSLQVSPPFVIGEDEIARVAAVFAETLSGVSVKSGV